MRVLLFNVHTPFLYSLAETGHDLFCMEGGPASLGWVEWNEAQRPRPANVHSVQMSEVREKEYDVLVLQTPRQWELRELLFDLPRVYVEHNVEGDLCKHYVEDPRCIVVFHSGTAERQWGKRPGMEYRIIEIGVKDEFLEHTGETAEALAVVSGYRQRDNWCRYWLWKLAVATYPNRVVGGMNGQMGTADWESAGEIGEPVGSWDELKGVYERSRVYVSTPLTFPSMAEVEAMMAGMPMVRAGGIEEIGKVRQLVREFLEDQDRAQYEGRYARMFAQTNFGIERFCSEWNEVLETVSG